MKVSGDASTALLARNSMQTCGGQVEHVFGMNVADFVRDDCQHFFVTQSFNQLRIEHDDRASRHRP